MSILRTLAFPLLFVAGTAAGAQSVQYRSPAGVEYTALVDTGPVARAQRELAKEPRDRERILALAQAQVGARQFREAIATITRGLADAPDDPILLAWRGHRYLSVRDLDAARRDLERGTRIDSTLYGNWYHLGIVRYLRGEFAAAAEAFRRAQPLAPDPAEYTGSTDWLWMSLSRAGRAAEARAMLARYPDSLQVNNAYARRLHLYADAIRPEQLFTDADSGDVTVATLAYGLGNWYLLRGDTTAARAAFERSIASGGWPAFGFMASEAELRRLAARSGATVACPVQVFSAQQVERAVRPVADTGAPRFVGVAGPASATMVQFVVDTTGRAEPTSFRVMQGADSALVQAVRATLERRRFVPARAAGCAVRQVFQTWVAR